MLPSYALQYHPLFKRQFLKSRRQAMCAFYAISMKEIPTRRRTVTSSLNEMSTNQLGNRAVHGEGVSFDNRLPDRYLKTTRTGFPPPRIVALWRYPYPILRNSFKCGSCFTYCTIGTRLPSNSPLCIPYV